MKFEVNAKAMQNLAGMTLPKTFNERSEFRFINWVGFNEVAGKATYMNLLMSDGPKVGLPDNARKQHQEKLLACYLFNVPVIIYEEEPTKLSWTNSDGVVVEGRRRNFIVELPDGVDEQELVTAYREAIKQ